MARERNPKRRDGNEIEFSRIVAFSDGVFASRTALPLSLYNDGLPGLDPGRLPRPGIASLMWLALFFDPAARFVSRPPASG